MHRRPFLFPGIIFIAFLLYPFISDAQNEKGLPFITNYSPKTYNALPQTWCAQEDYRGIMYFGIQNYILEFDGVKWKKIVIGGAVLKCGKVHVEVEKRRDILRSI